MNRLRGLSVLLCLVLLSACVAPEQAPESNPPTTNTTVSAESDAEPTAPTSAEEANETSASSEPLSRINMEDLINDLAELDSYRLSMTTTTITTNDSEASDEAVVSYEEERISQPLAIKTTVQASSDEQSAITYIREGTMYQTSGQGDERTCSSLDMDPELLSGTVESARMMVGILSLILASSNGTPELIAGGETINGMTADHYRIANDPGDGISNAFNVWINEQGYLVQANSEIAMLTNGSGFTTAVELNIDDINQLESIEFPAECEN